MYREIPRARENLPCKVCSSLELIISSRLDKEVLGVGEEWMAIELIKLLVGYIGFIVSISILGPRFYARLSVPSLGNQLPL
jgi:hypothetical protein